MPFVVVNVDEQQFAAVQSDFSGHSSIKNIGESSTFIQDVRSLDRGGQGNANSVGKCSIPISMYGCIALPVPSIWLYRQVPAQSA